jgi:hypothetical protein
MKSGSILAIVLLSIFLASGCGPGQAKPVNSNKDMPRPADKGR